MVQADKVICDTCGKEQACHKAMVYGLPPDWVAGNRKVFCSAKCAKDYKPAPPEQLLVCPACGFEAKSEFGLRAHRRVHKEV